MSNGFVSYASEDREYVKELIVEVEKLGHRLWHYERDSLPAAVYMEEIPKAIDGCDIIVLVASRASLDSHQVTSEVQQGHQLQKKFLPIYRGVTSDDIRALQPSWTTALGATSYLKWTEGNLQRLVSDVVRALNAVAPPVITKPIQWAADATRIEIPNLSKVVFSTPAVNEFLANEHQFFISANKGVGKTLLLKSKRALLMQDHGGVKDGPKAEVQFIPESTPFLDITTAEWPSMDRDHIELLSTLRSCRRLWSFALRTSILSHFPEHFEKLNADLFVTNVRRPMEDILHPRTAATVIFKDLINSLTVKSINRLLDKMESNVEYAFRGIHSGVFMFVDRVEQGVSSLNQEAWINVQAGLIEAAWDVMNSNHHVKIYASIREEAYANYQSDSKINLFSAVLNLRYSLDELHEMLDSLSQLYEGQPTFHKFVRTQKVRNIPCRVEEDSFRYLHRHTVGRPRDLVVLCSEISRRRSQESEQQLRTTVNEVSSNVILPLVFEEHAVFLNCIRDVGERNRFLGLLPYNILTRPEIETICCAFNGLEAAEYSDVSGADCLLGHPFCELYNCGLIGTVREDTINETSVQEFKQPYDVMSQCESCLPTADYYLIHPSLNSMVQKFRGGSDYQVFRFVAVGHKYPWQHYFSMMLDVQRTLPSIHDRDLRQRVMSFMESNLSETNDTVVASNDALEELPAILEVLEQRGHEDVYLYLERFTTHVRETAVG